MDHFVVPFGLDGRGQVATFAQDSAAEVGQCVRILLGTRPGERLMVPQFGVDDLTFAGDVDDGWIVEAVVEWEPRADVSVVAGTVRELTDVTVEI